MDRRNYRFLAPLDARDARLERVNVSAHAGGCPGAVEGVGGGVEDGVLGGGLEVEACGEGFGAGAREDDGAGGGAGGEVGEEGGEFVPHSGWGLVSCWG